MNSIKEYAVKIRKIESEKEKLGKKLEELQDKYRKRGKELSYVKSEVKRIKASKENWKQKNKEKRAELHKTKRELKRGGKIKGHHYTTWLIVLSIALRVIGNCSYESIVKILQILNVQFNLNLPKIPCANSIQNWVSKLGLYILQKQEIPSIIGQKVCLIIDESIRLGQEKLLLILSVPIAKVKKTALQYRDVKVVYMKGAISWTGEKISEVVKTIQQSHGLEVAQILSDEDSKLIKACELSKISHTPDIAHGVATCLRRVFEKQEDFIAFRKLIASYSSKGVNQALSYLCPPKQRTKARFMNIRKITNWANSMLENFKKLNEKEQTFFKDLLDQQSFIGVLEECIKLAKAISLPFKQKGLSTQTLKEAQQHIDANEDAQGYLQQFLQNLQVYMTRYQKIIKNFEGIPIHVSSEVIESLFGKYKSKANNYALTGLTTLNLELPLYGFDLEEIKQHVEQALLDISIKELTQWKVKNASDNQLVKRNQFFKK